MIRKNYQKELDAILSNRQGKIPRVLLHSCCGPCSSSVLEYLTQYFDVTLLWYNPNLYPESEYTKRLETQQELIEKMDLGSKVHLCVEPWQNEDYMAAIRGLEQEPEGGERCAECFRVRLKKTAELAKKEGFDYFCTTLTLSRYKNAEVINTIGKEIEQSVGISWLPSDFKKQGREMRSSELARKYGLYQQRYCGCIFSLREREKRDESQKTAGDGFSDE